VEAGERERARTLAAEKVIRAVVLPRIARIACRGSHEHHSTDPKNNVIVNVPVT
jgi:hypothetical protein